MHWRFNLAASMRSEPTIEVQDLPGDVARLRACTTKFRAQDWPNAPIKLIIPYAPGGGNDRAARLLAKALEDQLKAPMSNNLCL